MKTYPVMDRVNRQEREALELPGSGLAYHCLGMPVKGVKAIYSGEKRPPRKGEWYLSGAIPEAYRAPNDLDTPYHIARLVKVRTETREVIEKHL